METFCPKCGRKGRGLCVECFLEEHPIGLKPVRLSLCGCGNFMYGKSWLKNVRESIHGIVERNLELSEGINIKDLKVNPEFKEDRIDLMIQVKGEYNGETFTEVFPSRVRVSKAVCPECNKLRSGYYEAILQLRTKKKPEIEVDSNFVSNVEKVRGGFDLYLTSLQYARQLKKIFRERGFSVNESSKLYGMKDGKNVYRVSIAVKEPHFSGGDFIEYGGDILKVVRMGKKILCRDVGTRKDRVINVDKAAQSRVVAHKSDLRDGIVTMVSPSEVQVLDLESNETHELRNEGLNLEPGQEINILKVGKKVYIL
ncbi:MAG: hypothetical protein JW778_00845 [Candidatus Altiarchaeota archaeon]|nr:hypothetical protein [Candidatus Altiarchaeota archaeon]